MLAISTEALNSKSLRELVNKFGVPGAAPMTCLLAWMMAKIIDVRTEVFR